MLCRQCQQLRQKYLKHTCEGREERSQACVRPARGRLRALPALTGRAWALLMASVVLQELAPGTPLVPNTRRDRLLRVPGRNCARWAPSVQRPCQLLSSVLSTQVLFRSLPVLPPVEHLCHTATHNTGERSKTVTPGPKARQHGFVVTLSEER